MCVINCQRRFGSYGPKDCGASDSFVVDAIGDGEDVVAALVGRSAYIIAAAGRMADWHRLVPCDNPSRRKARCCQTDPALALGDVLAVSAPL